MAIQEILLDFLEEKKDIKGFINIIDMSADKEKSKTNQKKIVWIFWAFMAIAIFVILNQTGYSDGDDTYFYHLFYHHGIFRVLILAISDVGRTNGCRSNCIYYI